MIRLIYEDIAAVQKYYPNIPNDTFMELISLDPTYTGKDSVGKYGKWLLNLFNRGKISEKDFDEIPDLLNQFTTYRNRISNKDLNSYKTLDDLAEILTQVVNDDSMLTPRQKVRFLKNVKSGKVQLNASDDFDIVLDTPNFVVYVPNTHEASMNLGKGTDWCTAHENPEWYNDYTENGHKLYIVQDKKTGERWQYSDKNGDFLDEDDNPFDVMSLLGQDDAEKLSKFFEKFLGVDYYNFDGTLIYTGKSISSDLAERVENVIVNNNVTSIGNSTFFGCSNLTSITITNSVTSIGNSTFVGCSSLKSITIPNSITSIGNYAFENCTSLTSINIPNSVTSIGYAAFKNCYSLTNILISEGITKINFGTFCSCRKLKNIIIPNGVTSIDNYAFIDCRNLKSITISNSVTNIDYGVFADCSSLTSITIPNSVTSIGERAFADCSSLKSITISNNTTSIEYGTFWKCHNLTSITIPDSVTSIGANAFSYCSDLTSITIGNNVTNIGESAFYGCSILTVYTDNDYAIKYCEENDIPVAPLSEKPKNESYRSSLKLRIKEY